MSALIADYESSDDEARPGPSTSASTANPSAAVVEQSEDEDEDDERIEAQARADAFGLQSTNGSGSTPQAGRKQNGNGSGKLTVASAPDVLKEVRHLCTTRMRQDGVWSRSADTGHRTQTTCRLRSLLVHPIRSSM